MIRQRSRMENFDLYLPAAQLVDNFGKLFHAFDDGLGRCGHGGELQRIGFVLRQPHACAEKQSENQHTDDNAKTLHGDSSSSKI